MEKIALLFLVAAASLAGPVYGIIQTLLAYRARERVKFIMAHLNQSDVDSTYARSALDRCRHLDEKNISACVVDLEQAVKSLKISDADRYYIEQAIHQPSRSGAISYVKDVLGIPANQH